MPETAYSKDKASEETQNVTREGGLGLQKQDEAPGPVHLSITTPLVGWWAAKEGVCASTRRGLRV